MVVNLSGSSSMGIPMMFPVTWEENTAANMTKIPLFELFPGLMVSDLYKAYRAGLNSGAIAQYDPASPDLKIINYVSSVSGKSPEVVADFFIALVKTINAGKAPASVLTAQAVTGIGEKTTSAVENVTASVSQYAVPISNTVKWVAVGVAGVALIYGLSVARPFLPRVRESRALSFSGVNKKNKKYSIAWKLKNKIWLQRHFGGRIFKHYIQNGTEYFLITPFSTLREGNEKTGWIY